MYDFRSSTLEISSCHTQFIAVEKKIKDHSNHTVRMTNTELRQAIKALKWIVKIRPLKKTDCRRLVRTCNQLILELNKNKGKTKPRKSQIVDKKDNTTTGDQQIQVASGGGLQMPFDESDYQWVQLMIDALIADDGLQLFQELHLNQTNQPNPQEHQNIAQHSVPAVSSLPPPHIRSSQQRRNHLVVLSPNDILRLANILQLSPETLTIAIDTLHPISIQAAYVRLLDGLRPSTTSSSSKNR